MKTSNFYDRFCKFVSCEQIAAIWAEAPACCPGCHDDQEFIELEEPEELSRLFVTVCCSMHNYLQELSPTDRKNIYKKAMEIIL